MPRFATAMLREDRRRGDPVFHPAAAALFRGQPREAAGGARIGRPSTYAATLQTLKDREYVRVEKNRFIPEESGRLVTASSSASSSGT